MFVIFSADALAYTGRMTMVNLHTDDALLARAGALAEQRHITLDALFTEALEQIAEMPAEADLKAACAKLRQPFADEPQGTWTREEMNERPSKFLSSLEAEAARRDRGNAFLKAVRESGSYYVDDRLTRDELNER
jgi:hypothetical protein